MISETCYVYKWTHIPSYKWYVGVRYKDGCHPDDGYICSSKIVKPMILNNPEEWKREIIAIGNKQDMFELECEILTASDAKHDIRSFNQHNGDGKFINKTTTKGIKKPEGFGEIISNKLKGIPKSESHKENLRKNHAKLSGENHPLYGKIKIMSDECKAKISETTKGRPKSKEHAEKIKNTHRNRIQYNSKPVNTPDGIFVSINEAARHYGIHKKSMKYWIEKKNPSEFFYIN